MEKGQGLFKKREKFELELKLLFTVTLSTQQHAIMRGIYQYVFQNGFLGQHPFSLTIALSAASLTFWTFR